MSQELDPRDYSRRTLLATERTYLAWWRTGLTALTVALASARVVPQLSDARTQWPYTVLGTAFAVLGLFFIVYGERRRAAVDRAVREGDFVEPSDRATLFLLVSGVALGVGFLLLILFEP